MQVLVTGGGGFLGSSIARALLKEGNNVSVIGRGQYPHLPSSIKVFQGYIRDFDLLNKFNL